MNETALKSLFDKVDAKFDIGTFEEFKGRMKTAEQRKKFHSKISEKFDIGTFEDMEKRLAGSGCLAGGVKNKQGKCVFPCLKGLKQYLVPGTTGQYKMGGGVYKFISTGKYTFTSNDPKKSKEGTWTCNSAGRVEMDGNPSKTLGFQWVNAPSEEEVKTGKKVLKFGMQGDFVTKVQNQLKSRGVDPRGIDGKFGQRTKNAVKKYQKELGLEPDGIVGRNTYVKLFFQAPKVEPTDVTPETQTTQTTNQRTEPGLNPVFEPQTPEIQRQSPIQPLTQLSDVLPSEQPTSRQTRRANRMARRQQNAHVDPKPTLKESLKTKLVEKQLEKENLIIESNIIINRFKLIGEGVILETEEQQDLFLESIISEMIYLKNQGYNSKVINEGLFSFLGGLFGGSFKAIPEVLGEYIARWLTKTLGVPENSYMQGVIIALVGDLTRDMGNIDKFFTDCRYITNKIADALIEGYFVKLQQEKDLQSGAGGFVVSALRNAIAQELLNSKDGIVQKLQDTIAELICPKLSKLAGKVEDATEDIKAKVTGS